MVFNGVPFDLAFQLSDEMRAAFAIQFSIFNGNKFDFNSFSWIEE